MGLLVSLLIDASSRKAEKLLDSLLILEILFFLGVHF
jgi:hypothetical protein